MSLLSPYYFPIISTVFPKKFPSYVAFMSLICPIIPLLFSRYFIMSLLFPYYAVWCPHYFFISSFVCPKSSLFSYDFPILSYGFPMSLLFIYVLSSFLFFKRYRPTICCRIFSPIISLLIPHYSLLVPYYFLKICSDYVLIISPLPTLCLPSIPLLFLLSPYYSPFGCLLFSCYFPMISVFSSFSYHFPIISRLVP